MTPAWFLFLFAPLPVEYVTGNSPYLNPFVYVGNFLLYGAGTILIREWKVRWGKGWLAMFLLTVAYVIAEEGLMLNTLFDPNANTSGRHLGVNWVWTAGMLVVHPLMSIFAPILLSEAIYHEKARESWVTPRMAFVLVGLFVANVFVLGHFIAPNNRPGVVYYLIELAIIGVCVWLASVVPGPRAAIAQAKVGRSPRWLFFAGMIGMLVTILVGFAAPSISMPAILQIAVMLAVCGGFLGFLNWNRAFDPELNPLSKFAVASGMISIWVVVSPLISLGKHSAGPVVFAGVVTVVLVRARKKLARGVG